MDFIAELTRNLPPELAGTVASVALTAVVGLAAIRAAQGIVSRTIFKKATEHYRLLARNIILYAGVVILAMAVLGKLGVDFSTLLGAAGIVGIAIGFASQTSVSNIISGLFLLGEKPFTVGDVIRVGDKTGIILSIDLMSIKIRTFDNLFIRLPNERVLNTEVVNITRFPIRRLDLTVTVAYKENVGRAREILLETARKNQFALREPEPIAIIQNFGTSGIDLFLGVWFLKTDFVLLKNSLFQEIKERLDAEGIEIPFPHLSLYAGAKSEALPIRIVGGSSVDGEAAGK